MNASPKYLRTIFSLAAVQVLLGLLCFIIQVVAIVNDNGHEASFIMNTITPGVWGGVLFLLTGTLGCFFCKAKSSGLLIAYIVLSVMSSLCCLIIMGTAVFAVREFEPRSDQFGVWQFGLYVCLLFFAVVELITAVMASAFSCVSHSSGVVTGPRAAGRLSYQTVYPNQVILVPSDSTNGMLLDGHQQVVYMPTTAPGVGGAAVIQCDSQTAELIPSMDQHIGSSQSHQIVSDDRFIPKPPPYTAET